MEHYITRFVNVQINEEVRLGERRSLNISGAPVRPEGLEPPTLWSEATRSVQLSYGRN